MLGVIGIVRMAVEIVSYLLTGTAVRVLGSTACLHLARHTSSPPEGSRHTSAPAGTCLAQEPCANHGLGLGHDGLGNSCRWIALRVCQQGRPRACCAAPPACTWCATAACPQYRVSEQSASCLGPCATTCTLGFV